MIQIQNPDGSVRQFPVPGMPAFMAGQFMWDTLHMPGVQVLRDDGSFAVVELGPALDSITIDGVHLAQALVEGVPALPPAPELPGVAPGSDTPVWVWIAAGYLVLRLFR